jgi:hypothetical protein
MDQISEIRAAGVLIVRAGVPSEVCALMRFILQTSNYPLTNFPPSFSGSSGLEAIVERLYFFEQ